MQPKRGQRKGGLSRGRKSARSESSGGRRETPAERERLRRAREARRAERRAEAEERRRIEAEEQGRRKRSWARPRVPVEPALEGAADGRSPERAGWVALVGRPNVGKSTLLNALLGQKLAATTHKPQTTRSNLLGVLNPPGAQVLLLDTPGHHQAKGPLNRYMVSQAEDAVRNADVVAFVIEARSDGRLTPGNERLCEVLDGSDTPVVGVLNKVDLIREREGLLLQMDALQKRLGRDRLVALVPLSARNKTGLEELVLELGRALPEGPPLLPDTEVTDRGERDIVAEFIREKAMLELEDELPYAVAVTIERFEDLRPKLVRVLATLHVERNSQKGMVIGRQGVRLKAIGVRARKDIEFLLGSKVFLDLSVRVTASWTSHRERLRDFGYTSRAPEKASAGEDIAAALRDLPEDILSAMQPDEDVS